MFTGISVWLDNDDQDEVTFRQALEWACLLRLPLEGWRAIENGSISLTNTSPSDRWFAQAAAERQVPWNRVFFRGDRVENMQQFMKSDVLLVCPQRERRAGGDCKLPHFILDGLHSSMMFASSTHHGLQRILILDHEAAFRAAFFDSAARLCARLGVEPVILTVARDEQFAQRRRDSLAVVISKHLHRAEFDLVLGSDLGRAVQLVAACRGCSHVVVENTAPSLRNCWWRRDPIDDLRRRLGDLGMVVQPRPVSEYAATPFAEPWPSQATPMLKTNASSDYRGEL